MIDILAVAISGSAVGYLSEMCFIVGGIVLLLAIYLEIYDRCKFQILMIMLVTGSISLFVSMMTGIMWLGFKLLS